MNSSISHQLKQLNIKKCVEELRELAADTIRSNSADFVGFLESDIDTYCHKVLLILNLLTYLSLVHSVDQ